jgi:predicted alpha/beta hydrolase family esterase
MSTSALPCRILSLPGWRNSCPLHWQSRWERLRQHQRVEQSDWEWPRRGDWMARLDEVLNEPGAPVVLVAHSLGCQLVASWAAHSKLTHRVKAAFLVAPVDSEQDDTPPQLFNWRPISQQPLPFSSLLVASQNDPYCRADRAAAFAAAWGSLLVAIGDCGHINSASHVADWPQGLRLLDTLIQPSLEPLPNQNSSYGH